MLNCMLHYPDITPTPDGKPLLRPTMIASASESKPVLICQVCRKEFPKFDQRGFRNPGFTAHQNRCIQRDLVAKTEADSKTCETRQRFILPAPPSVLPTNTNTQRVLDAATTNNADKLKKEIEHQHHHRYQHTLLNTPGSIYTDLYAVPATVNTGGQWFFSDTMASRFTPPNSLPILTEECYIASSQVFDMTSMARTTTTIADQVVNERSDILELGSSPLLNNDSYISQTIADNEYSASMLCASTLHYEELSQATMMHEASFLPVTECNYCVPEYGFHQADCLTYMSFMDFTAII